MYQNSDVRYDKSAQIWKLQYKTLKVVFKDKFERNKIVRHASNLKL